MSTPQGLRTPPQSTFNVFEDEDDRINHNAFTPCTRLSRMTIESQSNGQNRIRSGLFQLPVTNFAEKLMSAVREEEEEQQQQESSTSHPNLDMFLTSNKISMSKDNQMFSFSEDEDSDEGDLFSSSLCPMSSPERMYTKSSIFDDEPMHSFFDNEEELAADEEQNDYFDPTDNWLTQIYENNNETLIMNNNEINNEEEDDNNEEENRPPRFTVNNNKLEKKSRRTLPLEEDNSAHERLPLKEIRFEDYLSDDELHTKKKLSLSNGKSHKMRYMRTLSPPRYAKRKGKEPAENIMPLSTVM